MNKNNIGDDKTNYGIGFLFCTTLSLLLGTNLYNNFNSYLFTQQTVCIFFVWVSFFIGIGLLGYGFYVYDVENQYGIKKKIFMILGIILIILLIPLGLPITLYGISIKTFRLQNIMNHIFIYIVTMIISLISSSFFVKLIYYILSIFISQKLFNLMFINVFMTYLLYCLFYKLIGNFLFYITIKILKVNHKKKCKQFKKINPLINSKHQWILKSKYRKIEYYKNSKIEFSLESNLVPIKIMLISTFYLYIFNTSFSPIPKEINDYLTASFSIVSFYILLSDKFKENDIIK